jgi:hypothetical protein
VYPQAEKGIGTGRYNVIIGGFRTKIITKSRQERKAGSDTLALPIRGNLILNLASRLPETYLDTV